MINMFDGRYRFLSNFFEKEFTWRGKTYASSEHAYQAAKATNEGDHELIRNLTSPRMTKRYGREIKVREDWEDVKYDIMFEIVTAKFQDPYLRALLLETYPHQLKESNYWHDNIWGDCTCGKRDSCKEEGKNWLGEILMKVREELMA